MRVKVKLVVFEHPKPTEWRPYASYCHATRDFASMDDTVEGVVQSAKKWLLNLLEDRLNCKNLERNGWKVDENSAIPPIFTDEELIKLTEEIHVVENIEPKIIELDVELPKAIPRKR